MTARTRQRARTKRSVARRRGQLLRAPLAIARMGGDATAALPRIARVIENVDVQVRPQAQLTQLVYRLVAEGHRNSSATFGTSG
jgi:hypothetical protein